MCECDGLDVCEPVWLGVPLRVPVLLRVPELVSDTEPEPLDVPVSELLGVPVAVEDEVGTGENEPVLLALAPTLCVVVDDAVLEGVRVGEPVPLEEPDALAGSLAEPLTLPVDEAVPDELRLAVLVDETDDSAVPEGVPLEAAPSLRVADADDVCDGVLLGVPLRVVVPVIV